MPRAVCTANAALKTFCRNFQANQIHISSATTVAVNENRTHNALSADKVMLAYANVRCNDRTHQHNEAPDAKVEQTKTNRRKWGTHKWWISSKGQTQTYGGRRSKYVIWMFWYRTHADILKLPDHIPQPFSARYWRKLNKQKPRKWWKLNEELYCTTTRLARSCSLSPLGENQEVRRREANAFKDALNQINHGALLYE